MPRSYGAVHMLLRKARGLALAHSCVDCGKPAAQWSFDEPTGYSEDLTRYWPRCVRCHRLHDGLPVVGALSR